MDLSFLSKDDQEHMQTLFAVTGNSTLLQPEAAPKILKHLTTAQYIEGCRSVTSQADLELLMSGKGFSDLEVCLTESLKASNPAV